MFSDSSPFAPHPKFCSLPFSPLICAFQGVRVTSEVFITRFFGHLASGLANGRRSEGGRREKLGYLVSWLPLCLTTVPAVAGFSTGTAELLCWGTNGSLPWLQLSSATEQHFLHHPSKSRGGHDVMLLPGPWTPHHYFVSFFSFTHTSINCPFIKFS